jgi:hypothetical protein
MGPLKRYNGRLRAALLNVQAAGSGAIFFQPSEQARIIRLLSGSAVSEILFPSQPLITLSIIFQHLIFAKVLKTD